MVTGVETAGLVLAIFPIVMMGLTSYQDSVEKVRTWAKPRRQLNGHILDIRAQQASFLNTLEIVLHDITEPDEPDEIGQLLREPQSALWNRPDFVARLRKRLGQHADLWLQEVESLHEALKVVKSTIQVDDYGKVEWVETLRWRSVAPRLKLPFKELTIEKYIMRIDRANKNLREQVKFSSQLRASRKGGGGWKKIQIYDEYKRIRSGARDLHGVVISERFSKCNGCCLHTVQIRLEPRGWNELSSSNRRFKLVLSPSLRQVKRATLTVQEIEIDSAKDRAPEEQSQSPSISTTGAHQRRNASSLRRFARRPVVSSVATTAAAGQPHQSPQIGDICSILKLVPHSADSEKRIGFLIDDRESGGHHSVWISPDNFRSSEKARSLESMLLQTHSSESLTTNERLLLGVTLASGVLQYGGSWLRKHWRSSDIVFQLGPDAKPCIEHPYLEWEGLACDTYGQAVPQSSSTSNWTLSPLIRSEILCALGIALVELCFHRPLTALIEPCDKLGLDPENEPLIRLTTAKRLLVDVPERMGMEYADVVSKCLECPFTVKNTSWENGKFHWFVLEEVVYPLAQNLLVFRGQSQSR